jgi:Phosphate acetyl/butaryl transferase
MLSSSTPLVIRGHSWSRMQRSMLIPPSMTSGHCAKRNRSRPCARHRDAESRDPSGRGNRDHETQIDARRRGIVQDGRPGSVIDGPLAFDNAVSEEAAETKGIVSPVAGQADIFVVPDIEAGNMLAKQLEYLAKAEIAGIVLGARVPIILTSRADKAVARQGSCAIALLLARRKTQAIS